MVILPIAFPDPPLTDEAVTLRPWCGADVPQIMTACSDELIARFLPAVPSPYTDFDARMFMERIEWSRINQTGLGLAVTWTGNPDTVIGSIHLGVLDFNQRCGSFGYWTAPQARGQGSATRALRVMLRWAQKDLGIERFSLKTEVSNVASQKVALACGFVQEGIERGGCRLRDGTREDGLLFGLLTNELG
jgi:RimJ/RimL family protein N-acetyltransferase